MVLLVTVVLVVQEVMLVILEMLEQQEMLEILEQMEMAATVVLDSVTENGVLTLAVNEVGHAPPGTVPV
jgi:hypothetical protein